MVFDERFCAKYFNFKGRGPEKIMEIYSYAYRRLQEVSFSMVAAVGDDNGVFSVSPFHKNHIFHIKIGCRFKPQ